MGGDPLITCVDEGGPPSSCGVSSPAAEGGWDWGDGADYSRL